MTANRLVLFCLVGTLCGLAEAFAVAPASGRHAPALLSRTPPMRRVDAERLRMEEYSTKVKILAETRAPLRQARIFFFYPGTIIGASIAAYVSVLRAIGGKGEGLSDFLNLGVNMGIVAGAVFLLTRDLKGRKELLDEVALELGERKAEEGEADATVSKAAAANPELPLPLEEPEMSQSAKKKKKKKKSGGKKA